MEKACIFLIPMAFAVLAFFAGRNGDIVWGVFFCILAGGSAWGQHIHETEK